MNKIGTYYNRKIIWVTYDELLQGNMPKDNWICFMTCSKNKPDFPTFDSFTRDAIQNGILEFKGHSVFGELLHVWFDETINIMEVMESHAEIDIMTTWHNDQSFADVFWQCFFATCLPDSTDYNNLKIVCLDLDGVNREQELKKKIQRFEDNWIPKK